MITIEPTCGGYRALDIRDKIIYYTARAVTAELAIARVRFWAEQEAAASMRRPPEWKPTKRQPRMQTKPEYQER